MEDGCLQLLLPTKLPATLTGTLQALWSCASSFRFTQCLLACSRPETGVPSSPTADSRGKFLAAFAMQAHDLFMVQKHNLNGFSCFSHRKHTPPPWTWLTTWAGLHEAHERVHLDENEEERSGSQHVLPPPPGLQEDSNEVPQSAQRSLGTLGTSPV